MSDRTTEILRAAMGTIVEVAPEPPDFPTRPVFPARRGALRYAVVGFAATVALAVVGILLLNEWWSDSADEVVPDRPVDVILWQQEGATGLTADEVADEVMGWPGVQFTAVSHGQAAYVAFLDVFSGRQELIDMVDPLDFPDSVRLWTTGEFDRDALRAVAENWGFDFQINSEEFIPLYVEVGRLEQALRVQVIPSYRQVPADLSPPHLLIFGAEPTSSDFRRLWIEEWDRETAEFRMIVSDPSAMGWEAIDVPTGTAFIDEGALGSTILWQPENGGGVVRVAGLGFTSDQIADIIFGMRRGADHWEPSSLPADMSKWFEGPSAAPAGTHMTLIARPVDNSDSALLLMQQGTGGSDIAEIGLWNQLGRNLGADGFGFRIVEVRETPAYLIEYPDGSVLYLWAETPDHAIELFVEGLPADSVITSIVELTPDEWKALRQRHIGSGLLPPTDWQL